MAINFEKLKWWDLYLNFFMNKEAVSQAVIGEVVKEKITTETVPFAIMAMFLLICLHQNIAKPISMGHLRSTVIGNSIAFILEKLGISQFGLTI